jgi:hypothetical protein
VMGHERDRHVSATATSSRSVETETKLKARGFKSRIKPMGVTAYRSKACPKRK